MISSTDEVKQRPIVEELDRLPDVLNAEGYVIVQTGIERKLLEGVIDDIFEHTGTSRHDPESWYRADTIRAHAGMAEMYHYQSMWDIRQHPALYEIFQAVHESPRLWVSLDRVAMKPPARVEHPEFCVDGFIHWDTDIDMYPDTPFLVQGVLALDDTGPDMGGFQCVPSVYKKLQAFVDEYAGERPIPRKPDIVGYEIVQVPLQAGEVVIWKSTMLHGNGRNNSEGLRLAQYVSMNPVPADEGEREELRAERVASWSGNDPAPGKSFPGDPRHVEQQRNAPAQLTDLGRRLLGLEDWDAGTVRRS
jgi:ectoine hydroxylase-related dioxygenase (phytanoyl-CoA dioxygenase family)